MKLLMVSSPTEYGSHFPMDLYVIDVPFAFEVQVDPLGTFLPKGFTDAQRDVIEQLFDNAKPQFTIDHIQPEWIQWGREHIKNAGGECELHEGDDELAAAIYLHYSFMTLAGCSAVYDLIWF